MDTILDQIHPFLVLTVVFLRAYGLMGYDVAHSAQNAQHFGGIYTYFQQVMP
jgi:hypothetical protein